MSKLYENDPAVSAAMSRVTLAYQEVCSALSELSAVLPDVEIEAPSVYAIRSIGVADRFYTEGLQITITMGVHSV